MAETVLRPARRALAQFAAVSFVFVAVLGWLGGRILEQDRALEIKRVQDRLERAADLIVASLDLGLADTLNRLSTVSDPGTNTVAVSFSSDGIQSRPAGRLVYLPEVPAAIQEAPASAFEVGERLEFRTRDLPGAIGIFSALSVSSDPLVRAGALLRLGRCLRKNGQIAEALSVYESLSKLGSIPVGGDPAELVAREARCALLKESDRLAEWERESGSLDADLQGGRWNLDRVSYEFHSREIGQGRADDPGEQDRRRNAAALAAGVEALWSQWREIKSGPGTGRGRRSLWVDGRAILLLWEGTPDRLDGLAAGPGYIESRWGASWRDQDVAVSLQDAESHDILRPLPAGNPQLALRASSDTRLPWTLRVASADPAADRAQGAGRRRLLLAGLALMGLVVLAGGYFTMRAVSRELAVSRLQSDFVSAVSHEFRTPLTSMLHLTDSLDRGIVSDEDRRRQYYSALARETTRLHRLVESLLNFGRMESGAFEYRFEPVDLAALAGEVVSEFGKEEASRGRRFEIRADPGLPAVRADREALGLAVWNLLDNAVKYSPGKPEIRIELEREGKRIALRVRDQGPGIPGEEQKRIFDKFVRGSAARAANIKGTGIGLAIVEHTARAHGGEVRVESRPGEGSTFTILLPEKG